MTPIVIAAVAFVAAVALVVMVAMLTGGEDKVDKRLAQLQDGGGPAGPTREEQQQVRRAAQKNIAKIGAIITPTEEKDQTALKARMIQAGLYSPQALPVFLGVKMLLMVMPIVIGTAIGASGMFSPTVDLKTGAICGAIGSVLGLIGPSFWLDRRKTTRQIMLRRALPDAMDVIVVCLEGGLSLPAAFARVATELQVAHPLLALELNILQREIQLGQSTGEALKSFARRSDMEEVRSLSGVIQQAEKYGASMANALRIHAESLRLKRAQRAEELAHQAATKIMFPTLLFIFPAVFLVILGPAMIQITAMFAERGM